MRKLGVVLLLCGLAGASSFAQTAGSRALPHVIVYKTKANYNNLVPVTLSKDKKTIVSYPAPSDVTNGSGYATPVALHGGYLLDRRGVGGNTAFLKLTYEDYSKLKDLPSQADMYKMIVDKSPMKELCDCGVRAEGKNSEKQLNYMIDKKQLKKKCKQIK